MINMEEDEPKETLKKYNILFEELSDALFLEDTDGEILEVNKSACELLGYDYNELIGMNVDDLVPEDAPAFLPDEIDEATREGKPLETLNERKDGSLVPIELRGRIIELKGEKKMLLSVRDITERKEAEEREKFLHSLLRHDVRNKGQVVFGYLELLKDFDLHEDAKGYTKKAMDGVQEMMEIIEKVRNLRKAEEEKIKELDVFSTVRECMKRLRPQAKVKGVEIIVEPHDEDYIVKGGSLLDCVFSNIIENSIQHSEGSKIKISEKSEDGEVIYTIEDNGKGISDENKEKIFDKGYTTDPERGSGLGMFLVKMLLENYGGIIKVKDSELGGARFDVHLQKA
ncbi:hypothetical protein AKJ52_02470 [candidate division MSBL1 archaeon SCGC-AAA382C18]|uniref:Histidine kinase n=1 Tax=candidate division MSBL1 archaeon SCGC-AAA382C18 TaxID=1698281 RepID=A0A133VIC9_9EURY|nr:hypothetical protein AKJ52_02470 [candidate division MSBL1 archaeon SCGC-AAA382C18]